MPLSFKGLGKRIEKAIRESSYRTPVNLAAVSGIPRTTILDYIAERREPGAYKLKKIAHTLKISVDWLLTGEEPGKQPSDESMFVDVPLVGVAAGGAPIANGYPEIEIVKIPKAIKHGLGPGRYEAAWCKGDSVEPLIKDAALAIYRSQPVDLKKLDPHGVYVINIPTEAGVTIKRLRYREKVGEVDLIPINTQHEIQTYRARDVHVLGVVVGKAWEKI